MNSWYDATAGRPSTNTARLRTPVVPASIAITHESVLSTGETVVPRANSSLMRRRRTVRDVGRAHAPGSDGYAGWAVRTELG